MIPILPLITRAGAMLMLKLRAKRAARKKILKDAALKKQVDKIGKKAAKRAAKKKEAKKKEPETDYRERRRKREEPRQNNEERRRDFTKRKKFDEAVDRAMEYTLPKSLKKVKTHEFDEIMKKEKYKHDLQKEAKRRRN